MAILIKNCRLIDGVSEQPHDAVDVLVEGRTIRGVGERLPAPESAFVVDGSGKTLLPGLIDTHVHLTFDGSLDPVRDLIGESHYITLLRAARNAALTLRRGVTTVRDLGGPAGIPYAVRDAVRQGIVPGPRILTSGQVITSTGGHCYFMGHEADDPASVRHSARLEMKAGADVVKIMATGGSLTPGCVADLIQFSADEMIPAVKEAHDHGLKVAAHANALQGIRNAVEAGVDSIEHGSYTDRELMALMQIKGTWWVPTMTPALVILEGPGSALISSERKASAGKNWKARRQAVMEGIRMGLRFASGTDAGVTLTDHGLVSMEVEAFHALGMPAMQAIWTATRWAAELLGIDGLVGTVAEGKTADLILVDGDPLADLSRLRAPLLVIHDGAIVEGCAPTWPNV